MKTNLTIGAMITVAAAVAVMIWQQSRMRALENENAQLKTQTAQFREAKSQLDHLRKAQVDPAELERLRGLQAEVLQLRARVNTGQRAVSEVAELKSELNRQKQDAPGTNQFPAAIGEITKGMIEQQMAMRVTRMKTKLNLSPEQEEAIKGILQQQGARGAEFAQKMFSGKLGRDEMAKAAREAGDPEEQIKAVLSPEQRNAYDEFKKEESSGNARLMANAEMLQLQNTVGLTQDQQDRVFAALYEQSIKQMEGGQGGPKDGNMDAWIEQQLTQKMKALEGVLSPEQLEGYRRLQETQIKMMKTMMPKMNELVSPPEKPPTPRP